MKSERAIQLEYRQVKVQAGKLDECADEIKVVRQRLERLMEELRGSWEGESASLYLEKCNELSRKLKISSNNLDSTAKVISRAADIYRAAELAAIALAKN